MPKYPTCRDCEKTFRKDQMIYDDTYGPEQAAWRCKKCFADSRKSWNDMILFNPAKQTKADRKRAEKRLKEMDIRIYGKRPSRIQKKRKSYAH